MAILTAIYYNPWFLVTEHAFSDLGRRRASKPWLFSWSMIILGALVALIALPVALTARNKWETAAGFFMIEGGIFLILLGALPVDSPFHLVAALMFFVQVDLSFTLLGIGLFSSGRKGFGTAYVLLGITGPILAIWGDWPSIALLEAFGILLVDLWVFLMLVVYRPKAAGLPQPVRVQTRTHFL